MESGDRQRSASAVRHDREGGGGAVVALPLHARESSGVVVGLEGFQQHHQDQLDAFAALVEPIESRANRRLREPGRSMCLRAYLEEPAGFAQLTEEALDGEKPVGLLVYWVKKGEHRRAAPAGPLNPRSGCAHPQCANQDVCLVVGGER